MAAIEIGPGVPWRRREALRLEIVVATDYLEIMKTIRIAELRAHLSAHLRSVRRGHPLVVVDRDTPIAQIVPCPGGVLSHPIRQPLPQSCKPKDFRPPGPLKLRHDPVALLLDDRHLR
jgi:prevent-host-death family protein